MAHRTISYIDVFIAVNEDSEGFAVHLQCPTLKIDATTIAQMPLSEAENNSFLTRMERLSRNVEPDRVREDTWLMSQGEQIGVALFQNWQLELQQIMQAAQQPWQGVRFNITPKGPLANAIPWEVLSDPVSHRHLGHTRKLTIARVPKSSILSPPCPIAPGERVRLLAVSASPLKLGTVHADVELPEIEAALKRLKEKGRVDIVAASRQSWTETCELLEQFSPHMLHLIAHGKDEGVVFEDGTVVPYPVLFDELSGRENLRIVILNICESRHLLELNGLFGTKLEVPSLNGIWAILLNRTTISAEASKHFTVNLYQTLAYHHSLSVAVGQARHRLRGLDPQSALQWSTPMLHLACDALPFPISERLKSWVTAEAPTLVEIQSYQMRSQQIIQMIDQIKSAVVDSFPNHMDLLHIADKREHAKQLREIFIKTNYPHELIKWHNISLQIIRELNHKLDLTYNLINEALLLRMDKQEYKDKVEGIVSNYGILYSLSSELSEHINDLFTEYEELICNN